MAANLDAKNILVLGGGDGLAVRELLKYKQIEKITLVDLDAYMTTLFKENSILTDLNLQSFSNPKVQVINADAFQWVKNCTQNYDFIVIDFPDPSNFSVGKLYTNTFYREITKILNPEGVFVVQSTSPYFAPKSFWCIDKTLQSVGFKTLPYHCYVPSFGEWGYVLGAKKSLNSHQKYTIPLRFLTEEGFQQMTYFSTDMRANNTEINRLNNQQLVAYFDEEWGRVQ